MKKIDRKEEEGMILDVRYGKKACYAHTHPHIEKVSLKEKTLIKREGVQEMDSSKSNLIFAVFYTKKGKSWYTMVQAPNPEEAIKKFHRLWNNTLTVNKVGIMTADGLPHEITDEIKKFFNWFCSESQK